MLIHLLTVKNGVGEIYVATLAEELKSLGHQVDILLDHLDMPHGDLLFILGYLRIIDFSSLSKHASNLVIHASDLPKGKGWSPVAWQITEGASQIPFTMFEATEELDAGDIYKQDYLELEGTETFAEWRNLQWLLIHKMVVDFISKYPIIDPSPQTGPESYYRRRTAADDELDINATLADLFDKIRVCDPEKYPAWFSFRGREFELKIQPKAIVE